MTNNNHPITPPPELLQQWAVEYWGNPGETIGEGEKYIAIQSARWGADQELEACCEHLKRSMSPRATIDYLHATRRPRPKSQAEEALNALDDAMIGGHIITTSAAAPTIRAALERLRELEGNQ